MKLIKQLNIDESKEVFIVGDIHAEYSLFCKQLFNMGFNPNNGIVISVGDIIDRGSEPLQCISLIKEPWFYMVQGNHEDFCIQGFTDDHVAMYHKYPNNGGEWFYKLNEEVQANIINMFRSLPLILEVNYKGKKFGFVHADVPIPDWDKLKYELINDKQIDMRSVKDHCLWARNVVYMDTYNVVNIDNVFLGHTVLEEVKQVGNCTFLDTGAVFRNENNNHKLTILKLSDYV